MSGRPSECGCAGRERHAQLGGRRQGVGEGPQ